MGINYFEKYSQAVRDNGYGVVPLISGSKAPTADMDWPHHGWQPPDVDWIENYSSKNPDDGIGIVGGRLSFAFDFDTLSKKDNQRFLDLAKEVCGETPLLRVGQTPKIAAVYRAAEPIISIRIPEIDVLGLHSYLVAYGMHPKTHKPYKWVGTGAPHITPLSEVPAVTNAQVETVMSEIAKSVIGSDFIGFKLELDRNFMPLVLSSRTILAKQLLRRIFKGKRYSRSYAANMMRTRVPSGCWGLVLKPDVKGEQQWEGT
ncbi:MAG: bifunctional DNA primase/polymerase [Paracoccaceae bacterium]